MEFIYFFLLNNWNKLAWLPSNPHKLLYELNLIITICFHRRGKWGSDRWLSYPDRVAEWGGEGTGGQDPKSRLFHRIWCVFPFLLHLQCPPQKRVGGGEEKSRTKNSWCPCSVGTRNVCEDSKMPPENLRNVWFQILVLWHHHRSSPPLRKT